MYHRLFLFLTILCYFNSYGNDSITYHLVYFKDKKDKESRLRTPSAFLSEAAISRRVKFGIPITSEDLPVDKANIDLLRNIEGIKIINTSRWLNAAEISSSGKPQIIEQIEALVCVQKIQLLSRTKTKDKPASVEIDKGYYEKATKLIELKNSGQLPNFTEQDYNKSYKQNQMTGIPALHRLAGRMKNFHIAVFDAGFYKAFRIQGMEDLLDSSMIIRDFVDYDNSVWEDDQHGCNVLGFMKTYHPGYYIGSAPFARYSLMRTENTSGESKTEEVNWLLAAEFADSLGVDMIASSVGYHAFDEEGMSYTYEQLDGKTTIIATAANHAYKRGIMVITSAGNEGNGKWRKIGSPGDAESCITIGACDEKGFHVAFSSYGPTADGRIKPNYLVPGYRVNVASPFGSYAGNGTSYSTPIFAGAMANLMYLFPQTSLEDLKKAALFSASQKNLADTAYGYGIPDLALAACRLGLCDSTYQNGDVFWVKNEAVLFQDLNIYFRSSTKQSIKITVKTEVDGKQETLYKHSEKLKAGDWYDSDILLRIVGGTQKKRKRKYPVKNLILIFETSNGSFIRTFKLG